ncbi:hypothetical protein BJ138DRAFT_552965 [Hygrophoropsis aurantiaca]|uniref:Uncharacterized protein n=1 Tax=Hygrophoropsis aurantiaca TaxID=72124 RepID=A0ACB8A1J3_9AGAM|nr:hypothetical protein BJ138DRAFT_552965 [Hygrophoropsis aurantiaca]
MQPFAPFLAITVISGGFLEVLYIETMLNSRLVFCSESKLTVFLTCNTSVHLSIRSRIGPNPKLIPYVEIFYTLPDIYHLRSSATATYWVHLNLSSR